MPKAVSVETETPAVKKTTKKKVVKKKKPATKGGGPAKKNPANKKPAAEKKEVGSRGLTKEEKETQTLGTLQFLAKEPKQGDGFTKAALREELGYFMLGIPKLLKLELISENERNEEEAGKRYKINAQGRSAAKKGKLPEPE